MGVPSYFKNIIQNYNDLLIIYEEFNININNLNIHFLNNNFNLFKFKLFKSDNQAPIARREI